MIRVNVGSDSTPYGIRTALRLLFGAIIFLLQMVDACLRKTRSNLSADRRLRDRLSRILFNLAHPLELERRIDRSHDIVSGAVPADQAP